MIIANWINEESTFAVSLSSDGTLATMERENTSQVWSPPSKPIPLKNSIDDFEDFLALMEKGLQL